MDKFKLTKKEYIILGVSLLCLIVLFSIFFASRAAKNGDDEIVIKESEAQQVAIAQETPEPKIFVHIKGAVNLPGLYELSPGTRVNDAKFQPLNT